MRRLMLAGSAMLFVLAACDDAPKEMAATVPQESYAVADTSGAYGGALGFAGEAVDGRTAAQFAQAAPPAPPPPPPPPGADPAPDGDPDATDLERAGSLLAYSYGATLQLPARNVRAVMSAHEEICRSAGVAVCQLLSANVNESGPDYVYGYLSIRAEPTWLASFRDRLEADAEGADGRLTGTTVNAEDLTRLIVDTEARLRAQRTLRERLEALLQTQTDDVGDLLSVERELARVQGDIDSATSQLEVMRRRVDMSTLNLSYQPEPAPFSENAWAPLVNALNDFFGGIAAAAGAIVRLVAFLIPWTIVAIPVVWLLRRWWRKRRAKTLAAPGAS